MTTPRNPAWQTEVDRLQRENGSLARTYAACERLLRDRTEENERLRAEIARLNGLPCAAMHDISLPKNLW